MIQRLKQVTLMGRLVSPETLQFKDNSIYYSLNNNMGIEKYGTTKNGASFINGDISRPGNLISTPVKKKYI